MTEIIVEEMKFKKGNRFCAVDNHQHKTGKSFDILYTAITLEQLNNYLIEKGIFEKAFFTMTCFGIISIIYSVSLTLT